MKNKFMIVETIDPNKVILHAGNYYEVASALIQ